MTVQGWFCSNRVYEFKGWVFELSACSGPWPLKKNGDLRKRAGRVFYKVYDDFVKLSQCEKKKFRIGGGCQQI